MYTFDVRRFRERVRKYFARRTAKITGGYRDYAKKCVTSGYIPRASCIAQFFGRPLARIWTFIQIGRIRVIGGENLKHPGRFIFAPTHTQLFDPVVLFALMRRKGMHYMAAQEVMTGLNGMLGIIMGSMGSYPVDRSRGQTVVWPSIKMLIAGKSLAIFPEGRMYWFGECANLKRGAAVIGRFAQRHLDDSERVGLVPVNIFYHKRAPETVGKKGFWGLGLKWRGGVTVTVGKPLYFDEMESLTIDEIMEIIHDFICIAPTRLAPADRIN